MLFVDEVRIPPPPPSPPRVKAPADYLRMPPSFGEAYPYDSPLLDY